MRSIRIVTVEPNKGGIVTGSGTKTLVSDEGSPQVWQEIHNVTSIDVRIRPDEAVTAKVTLFLDTVEHKATSEFYARDPLTGERRLLKEIQWADGSAFIC